jgi:hypothetical protein
MMFLCSVLSVIASAQVSPTQNCPKISVVGPAGIVDPGNIVRFSVLFDREVSQSTAFEWEVSGGAIVGQRDRSVIEVLPEKYFNEKTTATVKVHGLPEGCASAASEIYEAVCDPYLVMEAALWTQYSGMSWQEERESLDSLVLKGLKSRPDNVIYLEKTFPSDMSKNDVDARIHRMKEYLTKVRKLPKNRFFIRSSIGGIRAQTTGYLVREDAPVLDPNYIDGCQQ